MIFDQSIKQASPSKKKKKKEDAQKKTATPKRGLVTHGNRKRKKERK
jgi:hypothetical protein